MQHLRFRRAPEFGQGIYQMTDGPSAHTHTYHKYCPWNADMSKFIYFQYEKGVVHGRLYLMDWPSGETRVIGTSTRWNAHQVANQFWIGRTSRILYQAGAAGDNIEYRIFDLDAEKRTFRAPASIGAGDERILVGSYTLGRVFPNDEISNRDQVGLISIAPESGETSLLCSIQRVIENHPRRSEIEGMHVLAKQELLHNRISKVAFNVANTPWFMCGLEKPKVGYLHVFDLDTGALTLVGKIGHHPIWHPTEPWLLSFSDDEQGRRRLTFDKLRDDGTFKREFLEYFATSGHPSVDPTERYIFNDNYGTRKGYITLDLFDLETGEIHQLAQCKRNTMGYPMVQLKRCERETLVDFLARANYSPGKGYIVQAHPAWDRTGRYVAFNSDAGGESQVYVIDLGELGFFKG